MRDGNYQPTLLPQLLFQHWLVTHIKFALWACFCTLSDPLLLGAGELCGSNKALLVVLEVK